MSTAALVALPAARTSVRVRPVPRSEPPTDDERGTARLAAEAPPVAAALPPLDPPTGARVQQSLHSTDASPGELPAPLRPPPSTDAVALRLATRRLLATFVEVVGGFRPIAQLRPFCLPEHFDAIANRLLGRPGSVPGGRGHGATRTSIVAGPPVRGGRAGPTRMTDRVAVRRVQVCDVLDGIAEIAVVLARRDKVWAMALRLELTGDRWLCTHLDVV